MIRTVKELRDILSGCANDVKVVFQDEDGNKHTDVRVYVSYWKAVDSPVWFTSQGMQEARDDVKIKTFKKPVLVFDL